MFPKNNYEKVLWICMRAAKTQTKAIGCILRKGLMVMSLDVGDNQMTVYCTADLPCSTWWTCHYHAPHMHTSTYRHSKE